MSLINPLTVTASFAAVLAALAWFRPNIARIVAGVFFLIMALAVNVPVTWMDPTLFGAAGAHALLPPYRWFFTEILSRYETALPLALALIAFETGVGVLILRGGRFARLGLAGAALFCLFIAPVGWEEIFSPLLAVPFVMLLRTKAGKVERQPYQQINA